MYCEILQKFIQTSLAVFMQVTLWYCALYYRIVMLTIGVLVF